ncbi:MAG: RDD family protein [Dehalococcoidia bacterium]
MSTIEAETAQIRYAGFWRRLAAYLVDCTIIGVMVGILNPFGVFGFVLPSIIAVVYFIGFWAWIGQTPGKAALGVKIVRLDGTPINLGTAILRFIGYIISCLILCIGFLMIAFHVQKRGLHDLIAGTIVVVETSAFRELHSKEEFESALGEVEAIQKEYHGI